MSVDMYVSSSQSQASSVSSMCKTQKEGYQELQKAITDFVVASPFLTGKAYDSAKAYFNTVLYPLAQGGILLSEAVEQAVKKFPEEYISQVDSGDLKQSELEENIRKADQLLSQAENIRRELHSSKTPDATKAFQLLGNAALIGMYSATKQKLEEQLQKLLAFNGSSPSIFSEIASLQQAVNQGLAQANTAWNGATGTFIVPKNLSWKNTISAKWAEYEERHADNLEVKKVTLQNGETFYEVYRNGKLDKDATNELAVEIAKDDLKSLKSFLAGASYQVLENNGVKALLDGLFGERDVKDSLQQHKGYNEGVFVGNLLGVFQAGAEYVGGAMWLFGGTAGSLVTAPATGGASLGTIPAVGANTLAVWAHGTAVGGMSVQNIMSGDNYNHKAKSVENMDEFFDTDFGSKLKNNVSKTKKRVDGQNVYKVDKNMPEYGLKKNDQLYLDGMHKDHLEVFGKHGDAKTVLNLDGSKNMDKAIKANGRVLK
ncbi:MULTISPECIES: T7SS effector LXG polymorphic toxin [unclassified Enterococcus]|uniref:T7SS effector LXG polymorphic toxin n=1 Tax=unclassified Enterococcus TaxID=2608891 RepID=UPI001CE1B0AB|nr:MULTISPECIES: T7SS effector LXG polymorphic toxin [unclassified Enterococcus]MCA5014043.1 transposase [Enterococcus sp. S23]MCA5017183.1 transposase [Enterococcus sp. S22(2020)]